ncbi:hypothetical protein AHF37_12635 [Paragonimus kellicotti]|nr:hypothetical protein AHF37_12635 [Paragonimus kellicotti]
MSSSVRRKQNHFTVTQGKDDEYGDTSYLNNLAYPIMRAKLNTRPIYNDFINRNYLDISLV